MYANRDLPCDVDSSQWANRDELWALAQSREVCGKSVNVWSRFNLKSKHGNKNTNLFGDRPLFSSPFIVKLNDVIIGNFDATIHQGYAWNLARVTGHTAGPINRFGRCFVHCYTQSKLKLNCDFYKTTNFSFSLCWMVPVTLVAQSKLVLDWPNLAPTNMSMDDRWLVNYRCRVQCHLAKGLLRMLDCLIAPKKEESLNNDVPDD